MGDEEGHEGGEDRARSHRYQVGVLTGAMERVRHPQLCAKVWLYSPSLGGIKYTSLRIFIPI